MSISRLSTFTLGLAFAVFALGFASPAFAGKDKNCDPVEGDVHPSCKDDGGGDPEPTDTFSVKVFLHDHYEGDGHDIDDGNVTVTEVKIKGNRQGLNGIMANPQLGLLTPSTPCLFMWNTPDVAQFSIATAKIPPNSDSLTYVEANIYNVTQSFFGDARLTLSFIPNKDLTFNDRLFPDDPDKPNVLKGNKIGVSISPDLRSCSGMIDPQDWTITVSKDP